MSSLPSGGRHDPVTDVSGLDIKRDGGQRTTTENYVYAIALHDSPE
jgi:hypothetical protein